MYYEFLSFILAQIKLYNNITDDKIIPMNKPIENIKDFQLRPVITYGNNSDWSNLRREEDFIITLQFFAEHGNYFDLNNLCRDVKKTIVKYCCSKMIGNSIYSIENFTFAASFETSFKSISLNLTVNVKELIK